MSLISDQRARIQIYGRPKRLDIRPALDRWFREKKIKHEDQPLRTDMTRFEIVTVCMVVIGVTLAVFLMGLRIIEWIGK